jgi:NAD(P)-dependent dehydrogenase (short-subunit alcohol dehydrogenase family)
MRKSFVVTGGGRGIGRAIAERLLGSDRIVAVINRDEDSLRWIRGHRQRARLIGVVGDAGDEADTERARKLAVAAAPLAGWVNNAARVS